MAAADLVDAYPAGLPGDSRRAADAEWGLTVPAEAAAGWPLHVGLRLTDGLLTAKAPALDAGAGVDPWTLLWWTARRGWCALAAPDRARALRPRS